MTPDSIVFYRSFFEAIKSIPDSGARLQAYEAILDYAFDGTTNKDISPFANIVLEMAKPQLDANAKRRQNGSKGGAPAGNQNAKKNNQKQPTVEFENNQKQPNVNVNENVNVNDNEKEIIKKKAQRFAPPTKESISEYCLEKGISIDIDRFLDYYESNGWKVGKNPMKDWKATVRNWARNNNSKPTGQGVSEHRPTSNNKFNNFEQRAYNFEELEKLI